MMAPKDIRVSKHGVWLLLGDEKLLLPFVDFPWFKGVATEQLCDVECLRPDHLYWPLLDVDLSVESILHPRRCPLVSKVIPDNAKGGSRSALLGHPNKKPCAL